jgi:alpha-beta hydrolase superfamily lysophospholipase
VTLLALITRVWRFGKWIVTVVAVLLLTIYLGWAYDSRGMLQLAPEHRIEFEHEFRARHEDETGWAEYLQIESRLAIELEEKIPSADRGDSLVDRYSSSSLSYPGNFPSNWNRSYEMTVPSPRGVAVLLHGLTDSPYSMLATAQTLAGAGFNVVVPRMPGHGYAVGGLKQARWEDWTAAVRIAIRHAKTLPGSDKSLLLGGYSNGGLLAIDYGLACDEMDDMPCPKGIILMSPAIAVSKAAIVTNLHPAISWMPYFDQFEWLSILPEVDPFKFTSFPKRAAWETFRVSIRMHKKLATPEEVAKLPPILTFQSAVDNTVSASAIITLLYDNLSANGSQLVVYDINRHSTVLNLMKTSPGDIVDYFRALAPLEFGITVLKNRDGSANDINAVMLSAGSTELDTAETQLAWPAGTISLSHIAVPFRSDDLVYGDGSAQEAGGSGLRLGALAPRGEAGVLTLSPTYFLRARHNPFYAYQARTVAKWVDEL